MLKFICSVSYGHGRMNNHKHTFTVILPGILWIILFALPGVAGAQVCCKCHPPNDPATIACLQTEAKALLKLDDCSTLPKSTTSETNWATPTA